MGAKDIKAKEYLSDNTRFADLCNYYLFEGKNMIRPENLVAQDTTELERPKKNYKCKNGEIY